MTKHHCNHRFISRLSLSTAAGLALTALTPMPALASGFYVAEQSVKGAGRAYSGEVSDQGAESLWWNPAAIGGMSGTEGDLGVSAIVASGSMTNNGSMVNRPYLPAPYTLLPVGGTNATGDPIRNGIVPTGAIAHAINSRIAVGLSINSPYDFTTQYASEYWERYDGTRSALHSIDIAPSLALALTSSISLGAALNVERVTATLANALPQLSPTLPDGAEALTGNGWNVGWSLGAQYHQGRLSVGASYKSSIRHTLNGSVNVSGLLGLLAAQNGAIATSASFRTPWMAIVGARYALTPRLTLNGQVSRVGWSNFDQITIGAPLNTAVPENYQDSWTYALGADFVATPGWTIRTGISRDLSPVQNTARDVRVPDSNRWVYAVGLSHDFSKALSMDFAAQYLTLANAPIDRSTEAYAGSPVATPIIMNGTLTNARVMVLSVGGRFRF